MEQRIIELEKKMAFAEETIEDLNTVVIENQKKIADLENQLKNLSDKMTSGDIVKKLEDEEPPPHY